MSAYSALLDARDWMKRMLHSRVDDTPPVIVEVTTNAAEVGTAPFYYSAVVTDDLAGIENVTLFTQVDMETITRYSLTNTSATNWNVTVPSRSHHTNLTMWVVVHDWGMNSVTGGLVTVLQSGGLAEILVPVAVAVGTCAIMVGIGVYLMKRRK
jgi:hypothetical protein